MWPLEWANIKGMALAKMSKMLALDWEDVPTPIRNGRRPAPMPEVMKSMIGTLLSRKGGME
jgi:hypothetical protein